MCPIKFPTVHYSYTCTNCGHVRLDRTDMNCRLSCLECNSLAFGLVKQKHLTKEEYEKLKVGLSQEVGWDWT